MNLRQAIGHALIMVGFLLWIINISYVMGIVAPPEPGLIVSILHAVITTCVGAILTLER